MNTGYTVIQLKVLGHRQKHSINVNTSRQKTANEFQSCHDVLYSFIGGAASHINYDFPHMWINLSGGGYFFVIIG